MLGTELSITANTDRPQQEALASMVSLAMLLGLVGAVSATLVFLPAQLLQAALIRFHWIAAAASAPIGAVFTWYAFDRVLPLDVNLGFDGLPALAGPQPLTWQHYLSALGFQAGVCAFSLSSLHLRRSGQERARALLILALALAALVFGIFWGTAMAELHPPPTVSSKP